MTEPENQVSESAEPVAPIQAGTRNPLRRLYDWVLSWAEHPAGPIMLFVLAFTEASFFPIPPDVLLIALALGSTKKSFHFALIATAGSVLGGAFGYLLGWMAAPLAKDLIVHLAGIDVYYDVANAYGKNAFGAIALAGFTPIPYKVFTLAAGIFHEQVGFWTLVGASALSRTVRFCLVGGLIFAFGPPVKRFIERWFNWLALLFGVLIIAGFIALGAGARSKDDPGIKAAVLLEEMAHPDQAMREPAYAQLKALAEKEGGPPAFGYDPAKSPKENDAALARWREWWKGRK